MTRYHSIGDNDSIVVDLIILGVMLIFFLVLLAMCVGPARERCERRGGVYLPREGACVKGPDSR